MGQRVRRSDDQEPHEVSDLSYDLISPALRQQREIIGEPLLLFDLVDSTNSVAHRLADEGYPDGTVVIANRQTAGRGRHGRSWLSPPNRNIYMSVLLKPPLDSRKATLLTLMAAVACCRTVRDLADIDASIKWPNDIVVGGRKCGGILTETRPAAGSVQFAILGIGINVNIGEDEFDEFRSCNATSLKMETSRAWDRSAVAVKAVGELDRWYRTLLDGRAACIRSEWLSLSSTIGKLVSVSGGAGTVVGVAADIDELGHLVLAMPDGSTRCASAGDISQMRAVGETS
ncbi:MAG TPA: biotin--[acetyl-CoA-carboxylase] ligase [Dissulfurispiraceae bacterium]|nr:biotin--[acetyl-CoA-carboxylase] ligase [Dissulfurispiraceae bacterium]